jgi:hypothetical protein
MKAEEAALKISRFFTPNAPVANVQSERNTPIATSMTFVWLSHARWRRRAARVTADPKSVD